MKTFSLINTHIFCILLIQFSPHYFSCLLLFTLQQINVHKQRNYLDSSLQLKHSLQSYSSVIHFCISLSNYNYTTQFNLIVLFTLQVTKFELVLQKNQNQQYVLFYTVGLDLLNVPPPFLRWDDVLFGINEALSEHSLLYLQILAKLLLNFSVNAQNKMKLAIPCD